MKKIKRNNLLWFLADFWRKKTNLRILFSFILIINGLSVFAQKQVTIRGSVVDSKNEPLYGVAIVLKNKPGVGVITDMEGKFSLTLDQDNTVLQVSLIGMQTQIIDVKGKSEIQIVMNEDSKLFEEVVVVGYGQQKKASVVGAITQTTGKVLERAGGVNSVAAALTGNLPGVITSSSTGMPGEEDPKIVIRGASSWNNSDPLVLVDGIERPLNSVDISSVQSISVLKDASATAVYGVKGANGVILLTTKRGADGTAKIDVGFNATMKAPSKLPNKLDSYDALMARNVAVEHELGLTPSSWEYIRPQSFINNYRNQTTEEQRERYPNVDWQDALFKDYAMSYNANLNVSGGTKVVKYFASADFVHEGDLFKVYDNNRNYDAGYGYNKLNVRSNLDFQVTKSTVFKVNIAGSNSVKKTPWGQTDNSTWAVAQQWSGAYNIAPDVFLPKYSDGSWGYYPSISNVTNSAATLSLGGAMQTTETKINSDFILEQDLNFVLKGLSARGTVSFDNMFVEFERGINDLYNNAQGKWINPDTGQEYYQQSYDGNNKFDWMQGVNWRTAGGTVKNDATLRNLYYQAQLNWARKLNLHSLSAMGVFSRQEQARGSVMPIYREDWVFRATYDYDGRYFAEYNGAYNGSDKFSKENRFAFFNSGAIGWMLTGEKFMESLKFIEMLKFRASYGEIGNDNVGPDPFDPKRRWLYMDQWAYGGNTTMDLNQGTSPYTWYRKSAVGNPAARWETVAKANIGVDYAFFGDLLAGSVDVFRDHRSDILVWGDDRSVPSYVGITPPTSNMGEVETNGYEAELRLNKTFSNQLRLWGNFSITHAKNEIIKKDDPALLPAYQKQAGYGIGQYRSYVDAGYMNTYDQLYGSTMHDSNDSQKLPGDYNIIDFNGDGVIDSKDQIPYGYTNVPENTYNATIGFEWKGFSSFIQFYGVNNVTRDVTLTSFGNKLNTVYDNGTWWSKDNQNADVVVPRWSSSPSYNNGTQFLYDGSYIRLKNAEIAYTMNKGWVSRIGINNMKIYLNGNNLWLWTRMPDDRESNLSGEGYLGAYPTVKRVNLGIKITL